jgi:hypothetical protein
VSERESVRAELAAAYAGIMAVAVLNMMPALAGILAQHLQLQAQTIGRFAACDSIGALLGTLFAAGAPVRACSGCRSCSMPPPC